MQVGDLGAISVTVSASADRVAGVVFRFTGDAVSKVGCQTGAADCCNRIGRRKTVLTPYRRRAASAVDLTRASLQCF